MCDHDYIGLTWGSITIVFVTSSTDPYHLSRYRHGGIIALFRTGLAVLGHFYSSIGLTVQANAPYLSGRLNFVMLNKGRFRRWVEFHGRAPACLTRILARPGRKWRGGLTCCIRLVVKLVHGQLTSLVNTKARTCLPVHTGQCVVAGLQANCPQYQILRLHTPKLN